MPEPTPRPQAWRDRPARPIRRALHGSHGWQWLRALRELPQASAETLQWALSSARRQALLRSRQWAARVARAVAGIAL